VIEITPLFPNVDKDLNRNINCDKKAKPRINQSKRLTCGKAVFLKNFCHSLLAISWLYLVLSSAFMCHLTTASMLASEGNLFSGNNSAVVDAIMSCAKKRGC